MARKRDRKAATQRSAAIPWALLDELEGDPTFVPIPSLPPTLTSTPSYLFMLHACCSSSHPPPIST